MTNTSGTPFREPPFKDGDVVTGGNYSQLAPGTAICAGVKNLTIKAGLFLNCVPQPTWHVESGNWAQIDFCSHQHPERVALGLPECAGNCRHRSKDKEVVELEYDDIVRREKSGATMPGYKAEMVKDKYGRDVLKYTVTEYVYRDKVV